MKAYHVATQEEKQERGFSLYAYEYDILIGPDGFECVLTEPEDRTWQRDGSNVIDELNRLYELTKKGGE